MDDEALLLPSPSNASEDAGFLLPVGPIADDDALLEYQFQAALAALSGLAPNLVRRAFQGSDPSNPGNAVPISPGPTVNWCAFRVVSNTPQNVKPDIQEVGPYAQQQRQAEEIEILASFYGPMGSAYARRVSQGLRLAQNRDGLRTFGLAFHETLPVMAMHEISGTTNQQTQRRFDLSMHFSRIAITTYQIESVLAVVGIARTDVGVKGLPFVIRSDARRSGAQGDAATGEEPQS